MRRIIVISVACILAAFVGLASFVSISYLRLPASPWNIRRGMSLNEVERCVGRPADWKETSVTRNMANAMWNQEKLEVLFEGGRVADMMAPDYHAALPPTFQIYIREFFSWPRSAPVLLP